MSEGVTSGAQYLTPGPGWLPRHGYRGSPTRGCASLTSAASQEYWDGRYEGVLPKFDETAIGFQDLYERYLPRGGTCFEVGCYPGRHLIYMGKKFGYTVNGIDWVPEVQTVTPEFLRRHGVKVGQFYNEDFEKFESDRQFDDVVVGPFQHRREEGPNVGLIIDYHDLFIHTFTCALGHRRG